MDNSIENTNASAIGTRIRKTMGDFKAQFNELTDEEKVAFLEELELMLAEIRIEIQNKKSNGKVADSDGEPSEKQKVIGVRVRKTMAELKVEFSGLSCDNKDILFSELEAFVGGVRKEVQDMKLND